MYSYLDGPVQQEPTASLDNEPNSLLDSASLLAEKRPVPPVAPNSGSLLEQVTALGEQRRNDPVWWQNAKNTGQFMLDSQTAILSNAQAYITEDLATVTGSLAGGLSAGMAVIDGVQRTNARDAYIATLGSVSGWWHDTVTQRQLQMSTNPALSNVMYENIGEGFEWAFDKIGMAGVEMGKTHIKPALEALGGEWTPEIEGRFYAYSMGGFAAALAAMGAKGTPKTPRGRHVSPSQKSLGLESIPEQQLGAEGVIMSREDVNAAVQEATSESVQQAAMEALWDQQYSELSPNARNDVQMVDFTRYNELSAVPKWKAKIARLEEIVADGFDPDTGIGLSKKERKKAKRELKRLKGLRPTGKPVRALPSPEMVDAEYTPTGDPHPSSYQRGVMPVMTKEWFRKWVWEGYNKETGQSTMAPDEAGFAAAYNQHAERTAAMNTMVARREAAYRGEDIIQQQQQAASVVNEMPQANAERIATAIRDSVLEQARRYDESVAGAPNLRDTPAQKSKVEGAHYWRRQATESVEASFAGEEAFRSNSVQKTEMGFVSSLEKLIDKIMVSPALLKSEPLKKTVMEFLQKHGEAIDYGAPFREMHAAYRRIEAQRGADRVRIESPDAEIRLKKKRLAQSPAKGDLEPGSDAPYGDFYDGAEPRLTDVDKMGLLQEYYSLKEAALHPTKGAVTDPSSLADLKAEGAEPRVSTKQHEVSGLGEQIEARQGATQAAQHKAGFVGATGRFYTPGEAGVLRWIVDEVVGIESLVAPLYNIAPGGIGDLPNHLNISIRPGDIPLPRQALAVQRFGLQLERMSEQPAIANMRRSTTTYRAGINRRSGPDPTYPRDVDAIASRTDSQLGADLKWDANAKADDARIRFIDSEWKMNQKKDKEAYDKSRSPWGKRIDRYWDAKEAKAWHQARKERMAETLKNYGIADDIRAQQKKYLSRPGADFEATRANTKGQPKEIELVNHTGGIDSITENWKHSKRMQKLHQLRQNESPSFESLKNVSAEMGYSGLREMLNDASRPLLEVIAKELGIPLEVRPLRASFLKRNRQLINDIIIEDRKVLPHRPWSDRAKGDDMYTSEAHAFAGSIKADEVVAYLDEVAMAEVKGREPPKEPLPRFIPADKMEAHLEGFIARRKDATARAANTAVRNRIDGKEKLLRAMEEEVKSIWPVKGEATAPAMAGANKIVAKYAKRIEVLEDATTAQLKRIEAKLEKSLAEPVRKLREEMEASRRIEDNLAVHRANLEKRSNVSKLVPEDEVVTYKMQIERARDATAMNKFMAKKNKALRNRVQFEAAKSRSETAARAELTAEMKAWAQARDLVRASKASRQRAFNTKRNEVLRTRAEMGSEGRYMADLHRTGKGIESMPAGPRRAAMRAEQQILSGKKIEGLPKDIYAKYLGAAAQPQRAAIRGNNPRNRQRGAVEAPSDLFGIGATTTKAFHTMAGILKRGEKKGRQYAQPDGARGFQKDAGGPESPHRFQQVAEILGGAMSMTPLVKKLRTVLDKAGNDSPAAQRLGELIQDFGALPSHAWTRVMGSGESFYNMNTRIRGMLLTGSKSEISLAHALQKHGAHYLTGVREWVPGFVSGTRGGLTKAMNLSLIRQLMGLEKMTEFGRDVRKSLDAARDMMLKAGVRGAPYVKNYFPYMLKRGLSLLDQDRLVDLVMKHGKAKGRKVDIDLVGNQIRAMSGDEGWMRGSMGIRNKRDKARELWAHERVRKVLDVVPAEELLPFIETDAPFVLTRYLRDASSRIAYASKFGVGDEKLIGRMNLVNKELQKIGESLTDKDRALIDDLLHITQREYVTPWSEGFTNVQRYAIGIANWAKLGMVVPGSMIEAILPLRNPVFVRHWIPAVIGQSVSYPVRSFVRQIYRAPPTKEKGWGTMGYDATVAEVLGKVVDVNNMDLLHANHAADLGGKVSNAAFIANGLHVMTNVLQTALQKTFRLGSERFLVREAEIRAGKRKRSALHDADKLMFEYYGIDVDKGISWINNGSKMNDPFFARNYAPSVIKYMQENVLTAQGVNQPKWHSNPNLGWLRHLKTYVTMFGNTVTMDLYHRAMNDTFREAPQHVAVKGRNSAAVFGTLAAMYFTAMGSEMLMDWYKYGGSEHHPLIERMNDHSGEWTSPAMAMRAMNRWAVGGVGGMVLFDLWESGQYNNRGFGDEGVIQDMMSGTVGKDGLRLMMMAFAAAHGMVDEDGNGLDARQLAAFAASQTPMATALPRNDRSPAEEFLPSKEDMAEFYEELFEQMGL